MGFLSNNFISEAITYLMRWLNMYISDYALIIILITVVLRLVLSPVDITQRVNSAKMQLINPEIQSLQKRYANNPQQVQLKLRELYKKYNVKPMAGCLPMILQLVLLFAFFGALRVIVAEQSVAMMLQGAQYGAETVKLPAFLWVHNVFQPDSGMASILPDANTFLTTLQTSNNGVTPQVLAMLQTNGLVSFSGSSLVVNTEAYNTLVNSIVSAKGLDGYSNGWFILPVLSGGTMFVSQLISRKQNPQQAEMQGGKFMLYFFPIFSIYICITSNTIFALYWTISNIVSLLLSTTLTRLFKKRAERQLQELKQNA